MQDKDATNTVAKGILSVSINNKDDLYAAYMPFIIGGGLFISTKRNYVMGEDIFILLQLMQEKEKIAITCKVVWVTPREAQGNKVMGVGVQFCGDESIQTRDKIETYLGPILKSKKPTHTM